MRRHALTKLVVTLAAIAVSSSPATAAVTISINQAGADVVETASGTFDTSLATYNGSSFSLGQYIIPNIGFLGMGNNNPITFYSLTGPATFGSGGVTYNTSSSGTTLGLNAGAHDFFLDSAYISNTPIAATALFANNTIAGMGLSPGNYVYAVGGNTVTISIGSVLPSVPEPATWAMMLLGFAGIGMAMNRRRNALAQIA